MDNTQSEISLIQALAGSSMPAFDQLYRQYKQAVYANIFKMVRQPEAAEDLLQEVFLSLWQNRHKIHTDRPVAGWLFVVSYNKAATYLKRQIKAGIVLVPENEYPENPEPEAQEEEELLSLKLSMIEEAINRLPARKKEVFRLCRLEGKPYEEVATLLGISVPSVKDYLKQSTRFIRSYVQDAPAATGLTSLSLLVIFLDTL